MSSSDQLSQSEEELIAPFVTNLDQRVFCLRNLPEVVKGALFARYSRSEKGLRRMLLDEFIRAPGAQFAEIVRQGELLQGGEIVAVEKAQAFYDRVLVGFGDDSVAELGGAHVACEGISNIAAKELESSRIGVSPLEKSSRYVSFGQKLRGRYSYYREPTIMASRYAPDYEHALDHLFDTYVSLLEPAIQWVQGNHPRDNATSPRAYLNATKAKALDLLRGLLPMATLTNVGLYGNGRAFEYLVIKLRASVHSESRILSQSLQRELDQVIPSFVQRSKTDRGLAYSDYLASTRFTLQEATQKVLGGIDAEDTTTVRLVDYDPDAETKTLAAILYPHSILPLEHLRALVVSLSFDERKRIIETFNGDRNSRVHRPGRAFEEPYYTFDLLADLGAYRDLQRHRMVTQDHQGYTVKHGYVIPPELDEAKLSRVFTQALEQAADLVEKVATELPQAAQYAVPFAFRVRWQMKLNLREAYHLIELRSARQGHPSYRRIAQEMYRQICSVHPVLTAGMKFVDLNQYDLERLAAEQRIDVKLRSNPGPPRGSNDAPP